MVKTQPVHKDQDILIFAKGLPPVIGGVETYSEELAKAYSQNNAQSVFVVTQFPGKRGVSRRGRIVVINVGKGNQLIVFLRFLRILYNLSRKNNGFDRFKIIHATTWRTGLPVSLFFRHPPFVVTVHGREVQVVPLLLRPLMAFVLNRAALIVGVSETALKAAKCNGSGSISAYNGLTYQEEALKAACRKRPIEDTEPINIYTFCRLVERKNIQGSLHAIGILKRRGISGFRYRIAGSGPMRTKLEKIVKDEGLEDYVEFLGHIPNNMITRLYHEADLFLHPQITAEKGKDIEGFGLTIADAMSFGAVIIAGQDGGPADYILNGETGLLVNGYDHTAIANALEGIILDHDARYRLSCQGRSWAMKTLSWQKHVDKIIENISQVT